MGNQTINQIYTIEQIKAITNKVFKDYNIVKATLFGSYAKGCAHENSDIDIIIDTSGKLLGLAFVGLMVELQEVLEKDIDLIDIKQVAVNSKLALAIKEHGVTIYSM